MNSSIEIIIEYKGILGIFYIKFDFLADLVMFFSQVHGIGDSEIMNVKNAGVEIERGFKTLQELLSDQCIVSKIEKITTQVLCEFKDSPRIEIGFLGIVESENQLNSLFQNTIDKAIQFQK